MIKTEIISTNVLQIIVPDKLQAEDFRQLAPQIDTIISQYGKIRLLIDASGFNGWENMAAFKNHVRFIKDRQKKVERIAAIAGHSWQHWLIGTARMFLHPEIEVYNKGRESDALQWITG
jgi:energy-converting hydrogenase Eha subunit G